MPEAPSFPIAATIAGVEVVTIPLADYRDLLSARRRLDEMGLRRIRFECPRPGVIDRDPELAVFVTERLQTMRRLDDLHAAAVARFGRERTPSRSAIHRYWQRLRAAGASEEGSSAPAAEQ